MAYSYWTTAGPSSEPFQACFPRKTSSPKPAVIFCPQAGAQASMWSKVDDATYGTRSRLLRNVCDIGEFVCATADFGPSNSMGNDTSTAKVKQVFDWLQTQPGVVPGPVIFVGTSMGNATACSFAKRYGPENVLGIVSFFGLTHTMNLYATDRAGMRAGIGTAWGVTYPQALPDRASPITYASDLKNVPWLGYTSTDDPLIYPQESAEFAEAIRNAGGKASHINFAAGGHSDTLISQVSVSDIVSFLNSTF